MQSLQEILATIAQLEEEREAIYRDDRVSSSEHPRLKDITKELARLWDLRRRIEAARNAGLDHIPVDAPDESALSD